MMSLQEFEARQVAARSSPTHNASGQQSRGKVEFEPLSTTALILEDRPPYGFFLSLCLSTVCLNTSCLAVQRLQRPFCFLTVCLCAGIFQPSQQRRPRDTDSSTSRWWLEPSGKVCFNLLHIPGGWSLTECIQTHSKPS